MSTAPEPATPKPKKPSSNAKVDIPIWFAAIIAVALLVMFMIVIFIMLKVAGDADTTTWARLTTVLSGFEAVVLSAAAFLFGNRIQKSQTDQAKAATTEASARADKYQEDADRLGQAASAGWALYHAVTAGAEAQPETAADAEQISPDIVPGGTQKVRSAPPARGERLAGASTVGGPGTAYLTELAQRLFEDVPKP